MRGIDRRLLYAIIIVSLLASAVYIYISCVMYLVYFDADRPSLERHVSMAIMAGIWSGACFFFEAMIIMFLVLSKKGARRPIIPPENNDNDDIKQM